MIIVQRQIGLYAACYELLYFRHRAQYKRIFLTDFTKYFKNIFEYIKNI
jgi:hypothetical protein